LFPCDFVLSLSYVGRDFSFSQSPISLQDSVQYIPLNRTSKFSDFQKMVLPNQFDPIVLSHGFIVKDYSRLSSVSMISLMSVQFTKCLQSCYSGSSITTGHINYSYADYFELSDFPPVCRHVAMFKLKLIDPYGDYLIFKHFNNCSIKDGLDGYDYPDPLDIVDICSTTFSFILDQFSSSDVYSDRLYRRRARESAYFGYFDSYFKKHGQPLPFDPSIGILCNWKRMIFHPDIGAKHYRNNTTGNFVIFDVPYDLRTPEVPILIDPCPIMPIDIPCISDKLNDVKSLLARDPVRLKVSQLGFESLTLVDYDHMVESGGDCCILQKSVIEAHLTLDYYMAKNYHPIIYQLLDQPRHQIRSKKNAN